MANMDTLNTNFLNCIRLRLVKYTSQTVKYYHGGHLKKSRRLDWTTRNGRKMAIIKRNRNEILLLGSERLGPQEGTSHDFILYLRALVKFYF